MALFEDDDYLDPQVFDNEAFSAQELTPGSFVIHSAHRYDTRIGTLRYFREPWLILSAVVAKTKRYKHGAYDITFLSAIGEIRKVRFPLNRKHYGFGKFKCHTPG